MRTYKRKNKYLYYYSSCVNEEEAITCLHIDKNYLFLIDFTMRPVFSTNTLNFKNDLVEKESCTAMPFFFLR